ncbi:hypothetical protein FSP39_020686, partial [Pinctada imbricata]
VFGAVAIGLGIWVAVDDPTFVALTHMDELSVIDQSYVLNGAYVIMAGGAAIFIFGLMGIIAACSANACLLGTWEKHLDQAIENKLKEEYNGLWNSENSFTKHFDNIQKSCCGFQNSSDFELTTNWNKTLDDGNTAVVPLACCKLKNSTSVGNDTSSAAQRIDCQASPTDENSFSMGCKEKIEDVFEKYQAIIIGVTVTLVFCQVNKLWAFKECLTGDLWK